MEVIEYVVYFDNFLKNIVKMFKLDGYIVLSIFNGEYFKNYLFRFFDCFDFS